MLFYEQCLVCAKINVFFDKNKCFIKRLPFDQIKLEGRGVEGKVFNSGVYRGTAKVVRFNV